MRPTRRWLFGLALCAAAWSCRGGGGSVPPPPPPGPGAPPEVISGPLADAPEELKAADLRLSPPPIEAVLVRRGDDGNTIVEVKLGKDARLERHLAIGLLAGQLGKEPGEAPRLRDDGQGGDALAGDGIFSLARPVPFDKVRSEQERMRAEAAAAKLTEVPVFDGRHLVGARPLPRIIDPDRFELLHSLPAFVDPRRSLFVTAPAVVEDPTRTVHPCTGAGTPMGVWTFGHLMQELAGGADPSAFTADFFAQLAAAAPVANGLVPPARDVSTLLALWPKRPDGALDLARAPMKLVAIVNRIDLAGNVSYGRVGGAEGRLIFQAMDPRTPDCKPLATPQIFQLIFEYGVPRDSCVALRDWALGWKALAAHPLGSPAYNAALAALTEPLVRAGAAPVRPGGSALHQLRTNEQALGGGWHLREFRLTAAGLRAVSVRQTPDVSYNGARSGARAAELAAWINARQAAVLAGRHTVTDFLGTGAGAAALLGPFAENRPVRKLVFGPAEEPLWLTSLWRATGIASPMLRHRFSLATCDGCHGRDTDTTFVHVGTPERGTRVGQEAQLSGFLTGSSVRDPDEPSLTHRFAELTRRAAVLQDFSEADCLVGPPALEPRPGHFFVPMPPLAVRPVLASH